MLEHPLGQIREYHWRTVLCRKSSPWLYYHSARLQTWHPNQHAPVD